MDKKSQGKENFDWGHEAEQLAAEYLVSKGYTVRERNWRLGKVCEIDIIAEIGARVVFVEVKTRRSDLGSSINSVDEKKLMKLARGADVYMRGLKNLRPYRFDIIAFSGTRENHVMEHVEDAFLPPIGGIKFK